MSAGLEEAGNGVRHPGVGDTDTCELPGWGAGTMSYALEKAVQALCH